MNNDNGWALSLLVATLPIVLTLIFCGTAVALGLAKWARIQHQCRTTTLSVQSELKGHLEELTALNPEARRLRDLRRIAEASLKAALASGNPVAIAGAKAFLLQVIGMQTLHRGRQQSHIRSADITKSSARHRLQQKTMARVEPNHSWPAGLAVRAHPPLSLTPSYSELPRFARLQKVQLRWRLDWAQRLPHWIRRALPSSAPLTGECATTLQQKGPRKWKLRLIEAK